MNIKIYKDTLDGPKELDYKHFIFPGGEVGLKLNANDYAFKDIITIPTIVARVQNSADLISIAMTKDALIRFNKKIDVNLFLPYVPYARQDRVCDKGEPFSLKVLANYINHLKFNEVTILDPHSDITPALLDNVRVIKQFDIINNWQKFIERIMKGVMFVSPDAGANKKTAELASFFGHSEFIRADKLRDLSTGKILETIIYANDLNKKDIVIADDICDGGRTFIELAKVLKHKNAGKIILYVTHGIFSQGIDTLLNQGIDEIWTTNSFNETYNFNEKLQIFDIKKFL